MFSVTYSRLHALTYRVQNRAQLISLIMIRIKLHNKNKNFET